MISRQRSRWNPWAQDLRFRRGRQDVLEPAEDIYLGREDEWLVPCSDHALVARYSGDRDLENSARKSGAMMGLIIGQSRRPRSGNPVSAGLRQLTLRETLRAMAMNDEETVAVTAGGHNFGKDARCRPGRPDRPEPRPRRSRRRCFGLDVRAGSPAMASLHHQLSVLLKAAWTPNPIPVDWLFDVLLQIRVGKVDSRASPARGSVFGPFGSSRRRTLAPEGGSCPGIGRSRS